MARQHSCRRISLVLREILRKSPVFPSRDRRVRFESFGLIPARRGFTRMERVQTSLPDVFELRPAVHRDSRGFFIETYHRSKFSELGIEDTFVQDNHSRSAQGTLRGLHYQLHHPQAKLCRVVEGEALDVAVDIRFGSPHFGKWTSVLLSSAEQNQIYIPAGFAHGFLALTDTVQFLYKCSGYYAPGDEYGVLWNDSDLAISWGISSPVLSQKDARNPKLADVPPEHLPHFQG
jgi:dTDP-4-dehydrorhamnose 3,5-epimerase